MKRRDLLLGTSVVTTGFAGCLSSRDNVTTDSEYETCPNTFVHRLPAPAEKEATAAIEKGRYETDGNLVLPEVMNIDKSYLVRYDDGYIYYKMSDTTNDGVAVLKATESTPKETVLPEMTNKMKSNVTVDIRIKYGTDLIFGDSIDLSAGETTDLDKSSDYPYGRYTATVKVYDGEEPREKEVTWINNHIQGVGDIVISADDVMVGDGPSAARNWCEWNDQGELVK